MPFTPASLLAQLMQLPVPQRYVVAFSGGVDSHVLLHALTQIRDSLPCSALHAIHINHGIHPDAAQWARHCDIVCRELGISFEARAIQVQRRPKHSLEATAREARYAALAQSIRARDLLLLAHHQDDQAETLLLQLLRGSGVKGLAGMPTSIAFAQGWLARPLLAHSRDELQDYAVEHQLPWVEDPSNLDTAFDRNFLRHAVMPLLRQRWPALDVTLSRAAHHQAEAAELLEVLAKQDLATLATAEPTVLSITALQQLEASRQRNALRYWLHRVCALPLPGTVQLQRILAEVLPAADDAMPLVHWPGAQVRRYRDRLYAMAPVAEFDTQWEQSWDGQGEMRLPTGELLTTRSTAGRGLRASDVARGMTIRFRRGGEHCQLHGRAHHHELKKLFQEWGIPPWQRDRIPLIYIGKELAQIMGVTICDPFMTQPGEKGLEIMTRAGHAAIETTPENKDNSPGCTP